MVSSSPGQPAGAGAQVRNGIFGTDIVENSPKCSNAGSFFKHRDIQKGVLVWGVCNHCKLLRHKGRKYKIIGFLIDLSYIYLGDASHLNPHILFTTHFSVVKYFTAYLN